MIETPGTPQAIAKGKEESEGSIADSSDAGMDTSSDGGSYELSSSMSMQRLMALEVKPNDADIGPVMNAAEQDERRSGLAIERDAELFQLIAQVGRNPHTYRREMARSMRRLMAEVYGVCRASNCCRALLWICRERTRKVSRGIEMRDKARALVIAKKRFLLIGDPLCM